MDTQKIKQTVTENVNKFKALPKKKKIIFGSASGGVLLLLILILCLAGGQDSRITLVQNSILKIDPSIKIANALNKNMTNIQWKIGKWSETVDCVKVIGIWNSSLYSSFVNDIEKELEMLKTAVDKEKRLIDTEQHVCKYKKISVPNALIAKGNKINAMDTKLSDFEKQIEIPIMKLFPAKGDIIEIAFIVNDDKSIVFKHGEIKTPDRKIKQYEKPSGLGPIKCSAFTSSEPSKVSINDKLFIALMYYNRTIQENMQEIRQEIAAFNQDLNAIKALE